MTVVDIYVRFTHVRMRQQGVAEPEEIRCCLRQVDDQMAVRPARGFLICVDHAFGVLGEHLSGEVCDLRAIPRVFENDHVMRVETDCSVFRRFFEHVLNEIDDARVVMVRMNGKPVSNNFLLLAALKVVQNE